MVVGLFVNLKLEFNEGDDAKGFFSAFLMTDLFNYGNFAFKSNSTEKYHSINSYLSSEFMTSDRKNCFFIFQSKLFSLIQLVCQQQEINIFKLFL